MVTKGIITSIDFNGNTCQVRIPLFETAGNDPIISTAIVSNTPGSYNGYKVGDVVLVAFEDGKMETPVVIGKLYLGAEKEKADPRGSLNTESLVAAKTAAVPADTKLTIDTDKNLPNTMNPYANLSSIANNLNKLNTDVNYLDVFTNNQFSSVITDVNKQGEELRSEIKQTASNIEAKVDKKHDSTTTGLGWNLTDTKWTIDATNTAWPTNKLTLFEVDRDGQVIINGNVRIGGYPQSRTRFYKKLAAGSDSPKAPDTNTATEKLPDEGWRETYEWENTCHIWETIQTIIYDTNDKGELELKITYSTPVDITGAAGEQGISIKSQIIYYAMVDSDITHVEKPDYVPKGGSNQDNHVYGNSTDNNIIDLTAASPVKGYGWSTTPHEYIDGWNYYTSVLTIYSDDNQAVSPAINHRNFADPVKAQELDGVYELAQGKSKNYYSEIDPAGTRGNDAYGLTMRKGYCWFDTGYTQISTPEAKSDYLGKWLRIQDANGDYVVKSGENPVRLIQWKDGITDQRYNMIKVGPDNIDTLISNKTIVVGMTEAFETGILSQWNGTNWVDISGELVTNKLTTNYINALDITTKKIHVKDANGNTLFKANGIPGEADSNKVTIGGFDVDHNKLSIGTIGSDNSIALISDKSITPIKIAGSSEKNNWSIVAGKNFGVDSSGKAYVSDINVDGIEFDTAYYSEGIDATVSFRYGRSGHPQPEEVIDGINVALSTNDSDADIAIWIKANIIRGATELSNNINCVVSYTWGEWAEDSSGTKHFDKNKIFYESKNVVLSSKDYPQDQQPFTSYVLVAHNKPNGFLIKESVKLSVTEVSTRTGNFINRRGFFVDSNNNHTSGYLFNLTPNSYAGEDNVGNEFTVKWFSDSKTEIEYDSTITLNNGNFMRVYLPSTEFKQLTSASISFHHDADEKDTSGSEYVGEYVYEYARTNLPKFSIGKIDYSKVFSDGVIIIDIVINGLGDNETYIPKYSDCITLHVSGSNELVWETAETEKLCSITMDRSNPNVSISNANNAITLKIDGNILGITHLYFSVEAIIDGEKKDIFKSASNIGLVYDSNTRSYNLSGQLNITTLASGWCVVKASCKYLKAKMA